ncbi:hypothetical protein ACFX5E_10055 [Flavobacterium sp. LS2P90]|uniref:DUF2268 domain-containing protein n=1 Tax=Flavobacterium xylosi TaxID=3230415 RepID=A0ABW6HWM5_9FLAO
MTKPFYEKIIYHPHFLGLFFFLTLFSCTKDDLENNSTISITNQLKNDLKLDQFANKNLSDNLIINWESLTKTEKDDFEVYEIEVNEKNPAIIKSNLFQNELKYELIAIKKEGEMHSYLIEAYSSLNHTLYSNSIQNLKNFTGTLNVYELNGNLIGQLVVYNGNSKNPFGKSSLTALNEAINLYCVQKNTTSRVPVCTLSEHVYTVYSIYTHHYISVTVGTYTQYNYAYTTVETFTINELMSVPCGGSEDSYDIVKRISSYREVIDVQITNELTGKAKCLNDLLDKNGDSFVKNLLANFEGESEFNIQIVSKDNVFSTETGLEINGKTLPPKNNVIVIEISTSRTNLNSSLDAARTILHEYIHADIFRKLNTTSGTTGERLDFKNTYEAYGNQHGTIAGLYLNSMKEALKGFHKTALIDDYNMYINYYGEAPSDAFYEALAWSGLRENNVKAWADLPAEKKAAIEALASRVDRFSRTVPCP